MESMKEKDISSVRISKANSQDNVVSCLMRVKEEYTRISERPHIFKPCTWRLHYINNINNIWAITFFISLKARDNTIL